jgi:hypothetical protein
VIICFCTATRENYFLWARADQRRNLLACRFDRCASFLSKGVNGSGVSELSREVWEHRVEDFRLDRRSRIVIQIDAIHGRAIRIDSPPLHSKRRR